MRALAITALLAAVALAGCFGGNDDTTEEHDHKDHDHCDPLDVANYTAEECEETPVDPGMGGNDTPAPPVPNVLPNATLTMTGPKGVIGAHDWIKPGDWMVFSAVGSTDADGEVALIGLTVTDGNGTRTAQLMEGGMFVDANFTFSHVGPVNVTIRVLDDDGEGVIRVASTAVNDVKVHNLEFTAAAPTGSADDCARPGESDDGGVPDVITNNVAKKSSISVQKGAMWISAVITSGEGSIAICDPDDNAISPAGTDVSTNDDADLSRAGQYNLMVYAGAGGDITIESVVHYEPKAAA